MAFTSNTFQPVMYDFNQERFYTQQPKYTPQDSVYYQLANLSPFNSRPRTYLDQMNNNPFSQFGQQQQSPVSQQQPYQYNAPSAQQMFPGMGNPMQGTMPQQSQGNPMLGGGNFGAGRFLGQNYANQTGLLGSPSTSMLGT
jgi:hypothetical protein